MQVTIQGKQIELGAALRNHVEDRLADTNSKFFDRATLANVTFSREGHGHGLIKTRIDMHVGKNIRIMAEACEGDAYLSFDKASEKVAHQLRKYKERLRDHHDRIENLDGAALWSASERVLSDGHDGHAPAENPPIVAEMTTEIETLSVSEAVMRMDLAGQPALLFRNASHDGLNMVYRRADGNVGWVDPIGNEVIAQTQTREKAKMHRA